MINLYYENNDKILTLEGLEKIKSEITLIKNSCFIKVIAATDTEMDFLTQYLKLHIITLKNIVSKKQLPKVEDYDNYISTIMYDVKYTDKQNCYITNPVIVILMKNMTLILAENTFEAMDEIFSRFSLNPNKAFTSASNLYYIAIDVLVDNLFPVLACFENKLDALQENILKNNAKDSNEKIIKIRKSLLELRKVFTYEQEILYKISHENMDYILQEQLPYMKDIFHHLEKLNATLQEYNDWASSLSDAYMSFSSSKLNENLNLLTIISFIFMPLSFLTGWYGMNFKIMPELNLDYGYFYFIGVVVIITFSMIIYFKRKKLL
jgi:magnesium transporter